MSILGHAFPSLPPFLGGRGSPGLEAEQVSPRKSSASPRGRLPPPPGALSLPGHDDLLLVDTGPPTHTESLGVASPSAREIRARPIDIDKEIPLIFVDEVLDGLTPTCASAASEGGGGSGGSGGGSGGGSSVAHTGNGSGGGLGTLPASRQLSGGGGLGASGTGSLATPHGSSGAGLSNIHIPQYSAVVGWEPPSAARRFRRPAGFIHYRPTASQERVAEYELDGEDLAWLADFNTAARAQLLDEERLEDMIDALEKSSFRALHGGAQAQRLGQASHSSATLVAGGGGASAATHPPAAARGGASPLHRGGGGSNGRRRDGKRSSLSVHSPQRSPKAHKAPKPDRPPPPSDSELMHLPAGLCRRYQQGRCHKGRSCKWRHEIWSELQARWDCWQNPDRAAACAAGPSAAASNATVAAACAAAAAAFPPPTTSGGPATHFTLESLRDKGVEDDPLGALALSELGVTSALELVPPDMRPQNLRPPADLPADGFVHAAGNGFGGCALPLGADSCGASVPLGASLRGGAVGAPLGADSAGMGHLCSLDPLAALTHPLNSLYADVGRGADDAAATDRHDDSLTSDVLLIPPINPAVFALPDAAAHDDDEAAVPPAAPSARDSNLLALPATDSTPAQESMPTEAVPPTSGLHPNGDDGIGDEIGDEIVGGGSMAEAAEAALAGFPCPMRPDEPRMKSDEPRMKSDEPMMKADEPIKSELPEACPMIDGASSSELSGHGLVTDSAVAAAADIDLFERTGVGMTPPALDSLTQGEAMDEDADGAGVAGDASDAGDADGAVTTPEGLTPGAAASDYGVPRSSLRELLRGAPRVQNGVYDHWLGRRRRDPEQLPLLSRLRQEAAAMRQREARLSTARTDVLALRVHFQRMRRLLGLVKRREKLKAQIAALHQAQFEAALKLRQRKPCSTGGSVAPTPSREVPQEDAVPPPQPPSSESSRRETSGFASGGSTIGSDGCTRRSARQVKGKGRVDDD